MGWLLRGPPFHHPITEGTDMKLIREKAVRELALDLAKESGRVRVSKTFLEGIEMKVRDAVSIRLRHHDNKCGSRKTLG